MVEKGFSDTAAKGILGNIFGESKFDAASIQKGGGPGHGLLQWEAGGRFDSEKDVLTLKKFAESRGKDWRDPLTQLDFMVAEMDRSDTYTDAEQADYNYEYGIARRLMEQAETPEEAARIFQEKYTKAGTPHLQTRTDYAKEFDEGFMRFPGSDVMLSAGEQAVPPSADIPVPAADDKPGWLRGAIDSAVDSASGLLKGYLGADEPIGQSDYSQAISEDNKQALSNAAKYYSMGDFVSSLIEGPAEPTPEMNLGPEYQVIDKLKEKGYTGDQIAAIFRGEDVPKIEEPADVPPKPGVVKSINKFGKTEDYQQVGDSWYRRKSDGTLAADPASGLTAANLNNTESPIVGASVPRIGGASAFTNPETIDYGKGSGKFLDDGVGRAAQSNIGKKFLDPQSNVVYHVSETTGLLLDSYGHPAPANVQGEFNKKQAGLLNEETAVPGLDTIPYNETSKVLTTKAETLQKKAQDEVDKTGQVSDETATELAQTKGQATQVTKFEVDGATLAEEERRQQAQLNKDALMTEYDKAKATAEGSGVANFPSFDEWKQRQGIDKDTDTGEKDTTTAAKAGVQSDVLTAITNDIQSIDDGSASGTTGSQAEGAVKQAGNDGQQKVEQSESFLAGIFGDLFNADEIKRMAILYTGSRLLGGSHGGSLNWAAKQYLTRVDAIAADHNATVKKLIEDGEYSPKSINKYKKTKDASVLVKLGVAPIPSGDKQMWYSPEGKRVQAEKFKVGDGYIWSADGGKTAIPASFHQEAERVRGTDKFNDRIRAEVPLLRDTLKELSIAAGDVTPGDSERGIKRTQRTNITPTDAALEAAQWAAKNGIDTAQMATYVDQAYRMAIAQSGGEDNVKPESLLPYLNQLKLRQDTGVSELFDIVTKDGLPTAMDAVKIEQLSRQFLQRAGGQGSISEGRNRDAVNLFWTKAAEIWAQKTKDNPDIVAEYQRKAGAGETAFYAYAKEQLNLPMK